MTAVWYLLKKMELIQISDECLILLSTPFVKFFAEERERERERERGIQNLETLLHNSHFV